MSAVLDSKPFVPVGKIKSFGAFGPKYEVLDAKRQLPDGDWLVAVRLVDSGEETEYRLSRLLQDPEGV